jgi:hypothetical protein
VLHNSPLDKELQENYNCLRWLSKIQGTPKSGSLDFQSLSILFLLIIIAQVKNVIQNITKPLVILWD